MLYKDFVVGCGLQKLVKKVDYVFVYHFSPWIETDRLRLSLRVNVSSKVLRLRKGPPKGSKYCDFLEVLRFLTLFRKSVKSVYQIYHGSRGFDLKKVYRYLRYCKNISLIEIDHKEEAGFLPAKYYRLTEKGHALVELFKNSK